MVEAYNANLIYADLVPIEKQEIQIIDEDDYMFYSDAYEERQNFLQKYSLEDICHYEGWPEPMICDEGLLHDIEEPF